MLIGIIDADWCNQPQFFKTKSFREYCEYNYEKNRKSLLKALTEFEQKFTERLLCFDVKWSDHPTEKGGSCEWAMPVKGTINGVYVSYIECQNPEKVWNHNSSRRKKRTTPKCRFWQPKKKGGEGK